MCARAVRATQDPDRTVFRHLTAELNEKADSDCQFIFEAMGRRIVCQGRFPFGDDHMFILSVLRVGTGSLL
jgi:hypothetical protein